MCSTVRIHQGVLLAEYNKTVIHQGIRLIVPARWHQHNNCQYIILHSRGDYFAVMLCVVDYASVNLNTLVASKRTSRCPDWPTIAGKKTR